MQAITLAGGSIWSGNIATTPALVNTFTGNVTINAGSSKVLEILFNKSYKTNDTERILVRFGEGGCIQLDSSNNGQLP
jgi:hypothetical protein